MQNPFTSLPLVPILLDLLSLVSDRFTVFLREEESHERKDPMRNSPLWSSFTGADNVHHIFAVEGGVWYELARRSAGTVIPQYKYATPSGACTNRGAVQYDDNATYICTGATLH